ncbi:uncharacterized protein ARMOST_11043 [Armillaria ostoyae]|uniref:Uncharacterized protein n=1 Tax=Armillaria ostoyae TaxID=47428 RepID=A0A284RG09_ARMOS|nr:uncharacterized protein ARMOST_11043 [Armillaria ostoyae]
MHTIPTREKSSNLFFALRPRLFLNALPSVSDRLVIQNLIDNAEEALSDFDQQVATVRARFSQYLDFHRSLLSTIRRLPEDVLPEISEHDCAESRRTVLDLNRPMIILSEVGSLVRTNLGSRSPNVRS